MQQAPLPPLPPSVPDVVVQAIMLVVVVLAALVVLWPVARALARRLDGRGAADLQDELENLRSRLEQVEQGQARLAEVEERLEFAERLLAQSRESDRLQR